MSLFDLPIYLVRIIILLFNLIKLLMEKKSVFKIVLTVIKYAVTIVLGYLVGDTEVIDNLLN